MTYKYSKKGSIHGTGINDADYPVQPRVNGKPTICPYYARWKDMIERCYSKKFQLKRPTYIGCTVVKEWLSFMNFREWMITQDWEGKYLDKDIIYPGNKIYGPDTCVFISSKVNNLLGERKLAIGKNLRGVGTAVRTKRYFARLLMNKESKYLGYFDTQEEATQAYKNEKRLYILKVACCEPDIRVKQGLYRHSELLR